MCIVPAVDGCTRAGRRRQGEKRASADQHGGDQIDVGYLYSDEGGESVTQKRKYPLIGLLNGFGKIRPLIRAIFFGSLKVLRRSDAVLLLAADGAMANFVNSMDKLNAFSFAAGFFFLSAAALSAYLICDSQEEDGLPDSQSQKARRQGERPPKPGCFDGVWVKRARFDDEVSFEEDASYREPSTQVSDVADDSEYDQEEFCSQCEQGLDKGDDEDSVEVEEEPATCIEEDEIFSLDNVSLIENESSNVLVATDEEDEMEQGTTVKRSDYGCGGGDDDDLISSEEGRPEQENSAADSSEITKLYKVEENIKISRYGSCAGDEGDGGDDQGLSYLHYNKVTTIGVIGPSDEGEDVEELLRAQTTCPDWMPFFAKSRCNTVPQANEGEGQADHAPLIRAPTESTLSVPSILPPVALPKIDEKWEAELESGDGNVSQSRFMPDLSPAKSHISDMTYTKGSPSSFKGETISPRKSRRSPESLLSSTSASPQWYAWEKDILGETFSEKMAQEGVMEEGNDGGGGVQGRAVDEGDSALESSSFNENGHARKVVAAGRPPPKTMPMTNIWRYKKFEPKPVTELEAVQKNKKTEEILLRKKYVSPYALNLKTPASARRLSK